MAREWTPAQEDAMRLSDKTLLVSAAAGSGKTSVLTERIIRRLLDPLHPADLSRLLVVTFTRAAAAELRSRIGDALSAAMEAHPDDSRLPRQMLLLGSAEISTIDAFFQRIVKAHFEELELPATFRMADPTELLPLSCEILDGVLDELYVRRRGDAPQGDTPMQEIRQNRFAANLNHLMSNRSDGKLNETLLAFYEQFHSYSDGIALLKKTAAELRDDADRDFAESRIGASFFALLRESYAYYLQQLRAFAEGILADPTDRNICGGMLCEDIAYCERVLETLDKDWQTAQSALASFLPGRFSGAKNKSAAVKEYQAWRHDVFRDEVDDLIALTAESSPALLSEKFRQTAELFDTLYAIFKTYEERLLAEKKARGLLGFEDVRRALWQLLTATDGTPSLLAEELAASYDEVYIDEYQDVDELQDRIFALIGKDHRFMVGDIKQSIYGFRGSEPRIFSGYRRRMPLYDRKKDATAPEYCIFMSENFRCNEEVIGFANQVCAFLFAACEDSIGYREEDDLKFSKLVPKGTPRHPVIVRTFEPKPRGRTEEEEDDRNDVNEETRFLIDEIRTLLSEGRLDNGKPITCDDIAILVRTKKAGLRITRALREANLSAVSDTSADPLENPLTMDTVNLLRAIDNPYRDLPLSEALLSPLGGFDLEELCRIRAAAPEEKALFDALTSFAETEKNDALGQRAAAWVENLLRWQKLATVQSADRFLRLFFREECMLPYAKDTALLQLYDCARSYQKNAFCSLYSFLDIFVKQAQAHKVAGDGLSKDASAIHVMTIHHSKGLEFPVVFVADCGGVRGADEKKSPLLYHRALGGASKLYDSIQNEVQGNLLHTVCAQMIRTDDAEEAIRVLYVALTRARERLYVSGTISKDWREKIRFMHPSRPRSILETSCDMYRVLAALYNAPHRADLTLDHQHTPYGDYQTRTESSVPSAKEDAPSPLPTVEHAATARYRRILEQSETSTYPLDFLQGLPTIVAASRLHSLATDEDAVERNETNALLESMSAPQPPFDSLLLDRQTPSAADIGTATHAFLQFCDFTALKNGDLDTELSRLENRRFLTPSAIAILRRDWLERFLRSDLFALLTTAREIRREVTFALRLPLSVIDPSIPAEHSRAHPLFVQGSIDLVITAEDGRRILVDYKSDHIPSEERTDEQRLQDRFLAAHGSQLSCYAVAIEQLYGKRPDAICIYSLPLGRMVRMETERLAPLSETLLR